MFVADRSSGGGEDASPIFGFTGYRRSPPALISRRTSRTGTFLQPFSKQNPVTLRGRIGQDLRQSQIRYLRQGNDQISALKYPWIEIGGAI
jgi:hypothetical protein